MSKGLTLIEVLLYLALASVVIGVATSVALRVLEDRAKHESVLEVEQIGELLLTRFEEKIRAADDVKKGAGESIFDAHPGKIVLDYPGDDTDIVFDTYLKTISLGGRTTTIRKIRIQEGPANAEDLTSDLVDVTNLAFRDFTQGTAPDNIQILLTVARVNIDNVPIYSAQQSFETAVTLRK